MSDVVRIALRQRQWSDAYDVHLRACVDRVDDADELAAADVLYFARKVGADEVVGELAAYPGCVVCAGTARDGTLLLAVRLGAVSAGDPIERVASMAHALLAAGVLAEAVSREK